MSRPTTRAAREAITQLNAYKRWNPDNDPEKEASLMELQVAIDNSKAAQIGRAVVKNPYVAKDDVAIENVVEGYKYKDIRLGRALIDGSIMFGSPNSRLMIGDGSFISGALNVIGPVSIEDSIISGTTSIHRSIVVGSRIMQSEVYGSLVSSSQIDETSVRDSSTIRDSLLWGTIAERAAFTRVSGSSGRIVVGGLVEDAHLYFTGQEAHFRFND